MHKSGHIYDMEQYADYHQFLFLRKVTNTLSPSEETELQELLKNETIGRAYKEFINELPDKEVATFFAKLDEPAFWENHIPYPILGHKKKAKYRRLFTKTLVAAGIIAVFITSAWYFFSGNRKQDKQFISAIKEQSIQLKLADGQVIDLNTQTGKISNEQLDIVNEKGNLSYIGKEQSAGINTITVPIGMSYLIHLPDGSKVWMNADTKLDFPSNFLNNKRQISIEGEAFLEIKKNPAQPFFVQLPDATVEVTGTSFNINTYNADQTRVSLVEGGVNLRAAKNVLKISPGYEGIYDPRKQTITSEPFDNKKTLSWKQGLYYFDEASLTEVFPLLWRWYGIRSVADRPEILNKKFSGMLNKEQSVEIFLDNLKAIAEIEGSFDKEGILHFK